MGIPKFFRWLTRRYPMILSTVKQEEEIPPIDNLYLDLNGIVHNCVHGNDPKRHERISRLEDMEELWASIAQAIDEVVHLVKPKQNIFLAVDGVAPRAKMNQQRARRFRSARERALLKAQIEARGKQMPELFDSNAISPGTKFMSDLCKQLHFFVKYKLNTDPLYKNLNSCVLSDGQVPGEGEHKMLDYIRQLRRNPNYDPNTRHCFYGADADLIMLSLLTHEPHFTIIREEHVVKRQKSGGVQRVELSHTNNFQLIHISLLREYMMLEYKELNGKLKFRFDIERVIDDFVFFCFFIGNDFLPSLSCVDIAEGSLDSLIEFYKKFLPTMDDYITEAGTIHWDRAEKFIELLGNHEKKVFQGRIDEISYKNKRDGRSREVTKTVTVSAEAQLLLEGEAGEMTGERGTSGMSNMYRTALHSKKSAKVNKYQITQGGKKYKKYLITKKFREDEENADKRMKKVEKDALNAKIQALYATQLSKATPAAEEEKKEPKVGLELIEELDEAYLSDLKAEDIPDDCVSEPDMNALENDATNQTQAAMSNLLTAQADIDAKAEEDNRKYMQEFVKLYAEDPFLAKQKYYKEKVDFDIANDDGVAQRKVMMKKYLEGLQWVLQYYYHGCTHWRWYYPFHYSPMVSDLGSNIVRDFLDSKTVIREFEVDFNCPDQPRPYTPFQQLLCIMPLRSITLLPTCYEAVARGDLIEYFPEDFPLDLNGKTVAWEALVLIPFADEKLFIQKEAEMFAANSACFNEEQVIRNNSSFTFFSYKFDSSVAGRPLKSTLTNLKGLDSDQSKLTIETDYENCGTEALGFTPKILPRVKLPSPGYPTFKTLGVIELKYDVVYQQKQHFQKCMVVIPQCIEETQPEELERYLIKLTKQAKKDVFVDFPYQNEAFPMSFEDQFQVYTLFGDYYDNKYTIQISEQTRNAKEWEAHVKRIRYKLEDAGIHCPHGNINVLASCYGVKDINFNTDYEDQYYYKVYDDRSIILPLSLMMRVRSPEHYMNMDSRVLSPDDEVSHNAQLICCKPNLYGLMGSCTGKDRRSGNFKVTFDKETELAKVHDPFMGQKAIEEYRVANAEAVNRSQQYFGEHEIDMILKSQDGVTATLTSSLMLKYWNPETKDRVLVDIGLNIKSWQKKQHVPGYVRFAVNQKSLAVNQIDEFSKKDYQKANRHVRPHWQYSANLVDILREYKEKFPDVFEQALQTRKRDRMPGIKDIFGSEDSNAVAKLKEVTRWIESLPISSLPFVDMGFDTLETSMVEAIHNKRKDISENYNNVNLQLRPNEYVHSKFIFMERYPYWSSMFPENTADKFKVGDRVLNMCSIKRFYIPYGARGSVVGKTEQKIIVMFDEQFIQGDSINGQCELYRGALVNPTHLMNITRKFENQLKKSNNKALVESFQERPLGEDQPLGPPNTGSTSSNNNQNQGGQQQRNQNQQNPQPGMFNPSAQDNLEESKGNQRQYRMKPEQQRAHDDQQQNQASRGGRGRGNRGDRDDNRGGRGGDRGRDVGRGGDRGDRRGGRGDRADRGDRGGRGDRVDRGGRGDRGDRGGDRAERGDRGDRGGRGRGRGDRQQQHQAAAAQQDVAESGEIPKISFAPMSALTELMDLVGNSDSQNPFGAPLGGSASQSTAEDQNPTSSQMSQKMVSLASPAFVPGQKPAEEPPAQSETTNPESQE